MSVRAGKDGRVRIQFKYADPARPGLRLTFNRLFDVPERVARGMEAELRRAAREGRLDELLALADRPPAARRGFASVARQYVVVHAAGLGKEGGGRGRDARSVVENYVVPFFGDRPLSSVRALDLEEFRAWMRTKAGRRGRPLALKTVHNAEIILRGILKWAAANGLIRSNPAASVPAIPRREYDLPLSNFWTAEEAAAALDALARHDDAVMGGGARRFRLPWSLIIAFAVETGLRAGEIGALTVADLRVREREVVVSKAHYLGAVQSTKGRNVRVVPISEGLAARLDRHVAGLAPGNPLLFPDTRGGPLTANAFNRILRWLAATVVVRTTADGDGRERKEMLRRISAHGLRHTCATLMATGDVAEEKLRLALGHRSHDVVRRYIHVARGPDHDVNRRLGDVLRGARERMLAEKSGKIAGHRSDADGCPLVSSFPSEREDTAPPTDGERSAT